MCAAFCRAFVDARALEYLRENLSDLILDDLVRVICIEFRMSAHEFVTPIRVLGKLVVCAQVFTVQKRGFEVGHLFFQASRQDCQTHNLNQADVFLLDVVQLFVRMVQTHRVLWRGQVVPQDQIQFVLAVPHPRDRCDRVVRLAVCFREDHRLGVAVFAPLCEDYAREVAELLLFRAVQAQDGHRILHDAAVHVLEAQNIERKFRLRFFHRKRMMSALEMLVRQNAAADNGKVGIAAEEVVRELLHKAEQLVKGRPIDDHRRMLGVHDDGVFVVVHIRRILEAPRLAVHRDRHNTKILSGRVRDGSRVADILDAG